MAFRLHPISEFMQTRDDKLCTCVTLLYAFLCIYVPIRAFYVVKNRLGSLHNPREMIKIGVFFEDLKTNNYWQASYYVVNMAERFLIIFIIILLMDLPFFQVAIMIMIS